MPLPRSIHQVREHKAEIQEIMSREWFPPVMAANDTDFDIWASMVLLHLTEQDADVNDVATYLYDLATTELAQPHGPDVMQRCQDVARELVGRRGQFFEH